MGGAKRNARKKRQQGKGSTPAIAQHKADDRKKVIVGAVVLVLLLGAVIGGVIYTNNKKSATDGTDIPVSTKATEVPYPVVREGAVVVAGETDAKVTVDVYEDFLCPACASFETTYGPELKQKVEDGTVRVRYFLLSMLNDKSDPPGYSLDSANAALCAADADAFPAFHDALFEAQPEEGGRGWDKKQLTELGKEIGITSSSFPSCVESGKYNDIVEQSFEKARTTDYLQQDFNGGRGFGTPTIVVDKKIVDVSDPQWLDNLVKDAS